MKTRRAHLFLLALALSACSGGGSTAEDAGPDAGDTDTGDPIPLTAVDLLLVVDDSDGMFREQQILSATLFAFVGSLLQPPTTSPNDAVDDLRIAAVSTNMGFSSAGVNNDAYWPDDIGAPTCEGLGDDGRFLSISAESVEIDSEVIPCPPFGGGWSETTSAAPNADLPTIAACLALQGYYGCDWAQQLASAFRGLTRDDQTGFMRGNALLAIVLVTDRDDCSMRDGQAMFAEEEFTDLSPLKIFLACGLHPEHLFAPSEYFDAFALVKGSPDAVVLAAIVGVPYDEQDGAAECQGYGDQLGECLSQDEMQLVAVETDNEIWRFVPACTRDVGAFEISARPARRFVELANDFGTNGYVYSICNADWTPAFDALSTMIAGKLAP